VRQRSDDGEKTPYPALRTSAGFSVSLLH